MRPRSPVWVPWPPAAWRIRSSWAASQGTSRYETSPRERRHHFRLGAKPYPTLLYPTLNPAFAFPKPRYGTLPQLERRRQPFWIWRATATMLTRSRVQIHAAWCCHAPGIKPCGSGICAVGCMCACHGGTHGQCLLCGHGLGLPHCRQVWKVFIHEAGGTFITQSLKGRVMA